MSILASIPYGLKPTGSVNTSNTTVGFGSLWIPIYSSPHGWVIRIDVITGRLLARIPVGESPESLAIVAGSVWVANTNGDASRPYAGQNTLNRIDPLTNRVIQSVPIQIGGPIVGGFGAVWVMSFQNGHGNGTLRKVDAVTGRIVAAFPLQGMPLVACGALWTADFVLSPSASSAGVIVVSRIDPRNGARTARWPVTIGEGGVPQDAIGRCFAVWTPGNDPSKSTIGGVSLSDGIGHVSPVIPTQIRIAGGSFWRITAEGLIQPYGEDGNPTGPASVLPATLPGQGDWTFIPVDGRFWIVTNNGVYEVSLAS